VIYISSDDGIYILKSNDGYRVVNATSIDNLYWWDGEGMKEDLNPERLIEYFGDCKVIKTKKKALDEAERLEVENLKTFGYNTEYGIQFISGWENKDFPQSE